MNVQCLIFPSTEDQHPMCHHAHPWVPTGQAQDHPGKGCTRPALRESLGNVLSSRTHHWPRVGTVPPDAANCPPGQHEAPSSTHPPDMPTRCRWCWASYGDEHFALLLWQGLFTRSACLLKGCLFLWFIGVLYIAWILTICGFQCI